jgi:hypothetical protein
LRARAKELAEQGQELLLAGDAAGALPLLEQAEATFHAPTILLLIGRARVKLGRYVEAHAALRSAAVERIGDDLPEPWKEAQRTAREELAALAPHVALLDVVAPPGITVREVRVDDVLVDRAGDAPYAVAPGEHSVALVTDQGRQRKTVGVSLGQRLRVTFEPEAPPTSQVGGGLFVGGLTALAAGGVGIGVGAGLRVRAVAIEDTLEEACPDLRCSRRYEPLYDEAKGLETGAIVAFSLGGALLATGAAFFIAGNVVAEAGPAPAKVGLGVSPGGFVVVGSVP